MEKLKVSAADEKRVKALGFLRNRGTDNFSGRVITVNGKITAEQTMAIAEAARKFGNGNITMTTRLTVECQGIPYEKIDDFIAAINAAGMITGGTGARTRPVVSCKGTTCRFGLIDTFALSEEIHNKFFLEMGKYSMPHKFKIAVGGCPNNCVKPDLNDVGVIGQRVPVYMTDKCKSCKKCGVELGCPVGASKLVDGKLVIDKAICNNCGRCLTNCYFGAISGEMTGYKIYIGGRWGKKTASGRALSKIFFDKDEVMKTVEKAFLLFREQGIQGERFAVTIDRLGFENVERELLSDDILARRDAILSAELKKA